jgi:hypothetical protein
VVHRLFLRIDPVAKLIERIGYKKSLVWGLLAMAFGAADSSRLDDPLLRDDARRLVHHRQRHHAAGRGNLMSR